jgi:predicted secreted protein
LNTGFFVKCFGVLVVLGLLAACGGGGSTSVSSPAAITAQPSDQSVAAGTTATFGVVASNSTGYQWQRSTDGGTTFADIGGATAASHTTPVTTSADSGTRYRVIVSGDANSVTSSTVSLIVAAGAVAPSISVHPAGQTISAGQSASFSVTAGGTALGYQWQQSVDGGANFTDIVGAANANLTLTAVPLVNSGRQYRVVVSNSDGNVTSNAATLTVNAAAAVPAFTTQPGNVAITEGQNAQFTVVVSGTPTPTLQWQLSTDSGTSWSNINGAIGPVLDVIGAALANTGRQYRAVASNSSGTVSSNAATLSVSAAAAAPAFTTQPVDVAVTEGQNAQLTVVVSGTPTPTLQWQLSTDNGANWSNINGATGATFNIVNPALANNGRQFRAVASNSAGTVNSNAATLTVTAASPVTITTSSPLPEGTVNVAYSVTLTASGGTPPFTWSVANGYTLPSFLTLNASTGEISGTPDAEASYAIRIQVADSANPPQSNQKYFDLVANAPCDKGYGWATVAGAPSTVEGTFCPQTRNGPTAPNGLGLVSVGWVETYAYGGGSYREVIGIQFDPATGQVASASFYLNDPTRSWTYICAATATVDYPACSGVTVNTATGTVHFVDTAVGSGTSPVFTLNGTLTY